MTYWACFKVNLDAGSGCMQPFIRFTKLSVKFLPQLDKSKAILSIFSQFFNQLRQYLVLSKVINSKMTIPIAKRSALYTSYFVQYCIYPIAASCYGDRIYQSILLLYASALQQAECLFYYSIQSRQSLTYPSGERKMFLVVKFPTAMPYCYRKKAASMSAPMIQSNYDSGKKESLSFFFYIAFSNVKLQQLQKV